MENRKKNLGMKLDLGRRQTPDNYLQALGKRAKDNWGRFEGKMVEDY